MLAPDVYSPLPARPVPSGHLWHGFATAGANPLKTATAVRILRAPTTREAFPFAYQAHVTVLNPLGEWQQFTDGIVLSMGSGHRWNLVGVADLSGFNFQTNYEERGQLYSFVIPNLSLSSVFTHAEKGITTVIVQKEFRPAVNRVPAWFDEVTARIRRFPTLQANWDSYGGRRISQPIVSRALGVASHLVKAHRPFSRMTVFVSPTSSGGILFEIRNGNREVLLEIAPDEPTEYAVSQIAVSASGEEENNVIVDESHLPEVLNWISENE